MSKAGVVKLRTSIFISYRRLDSADVTGRIKDVLRDSFGVDSIFVDVEKMPLGVDFPTHVENEIKRCGVLLAVIGRDWLTARNERGGLRLEQGDDIVRIELETALKNHIPVVPVLVRGAQMPSEDDLPESLKPLVFKSGIPVRADPDFRADVARLARGLGYQECTKRPHARVLAGRLTVSLALAEILQLLLFYFSDQNATRSAAVVLTSILGGVLAALGVRQRFVLVSVTGLCAVVLPWALILFAGPMIAAAGTAIAVCTLAVVSRSEGRSLL